MEQTFTWKPEPMLLKEIMAVALQQSSSPEAVINEAVKHYLELETSNQETESDPLVGLFASSPNLATESEEFLQQEITQAGWTWKKP